MFTFILFVLLLGFCYVLYAYLSNQIISQRKRIMLLINENNELKTKLNKMTASAAFSKANTFSQELLEEKTDHTPSDT